MDKTVCERTVVIISILIAFIVFGIIVLVHEFGHFIIAKKNGIRVVEFAIGMGPKLISFKKGETTYSLRILPIGGFCNMNEGEVTDDPKSFENKSVLARMSVIFAGPLFNFILAFTLIFLVALFAGYSSTTIDTVEKDSPAHTAGLQPGDQVDTINGSKMRVFLDIQFALSQQGDQPVDVGIIRNNEKIGYTIQPKLVEGRGYMIGFRPLEKNSFFGSIHEGFFKMVSLIKVSVLGLIQLVSGQVSMKNIAGPIGIVKMIGDTYSLSLQESIMLMVLNLCNLTAMLSANLGALNLIPIPALDGSRLIFLFIEAIRKKPVNATIENTVHGIGFALLMLLMVLVAYNDIMRVLFGA